jgi:hypothetical protein
MDGKIDCRRSLGLTYCSFGDEGVLLPPKGRIPVTFSPGESCGRCEAEVDRVRSLLESAGESVELRVEAGSGGNTLVKMGRATISGSPGPGELWRALRSAAP